VWYTLSDNEVIKQFTIVYHMHNWYENKYKKSKRLSTVKTKIKTISNIFLCANWMEKTYDFYGVDVDTSIKHILNMDEMVSFPMRKEFPMEDGGRTDKDDRFR
jgi:NADH-quinone oxidoreductase subunit C